jgi:hypothetical protein
VLTAESPFATADSHVPKCKLAHIVPGRKPAKISSRRLRGRGVTVEGEVVDGAAGDARKEALVGGAGDVRAERSGGLLAKEGKEISAKTSNVGRGHGSAGDGVLRCSVSMGNR